jgi:hypothetical protein
MTMLRLAWEIDGRQVVAENCHLNKTRRIHVTWTRDDGIGEDTYLVFVAPTSQRQPNSDVVVAKANVIDFLDRELDQPEEKQALMMRWIDLCVERHGEDCQAKQEPDLDFKNLMQSTYFGVIDVVDMVLKELPSDSTGKPEQYVALSYVWGKPQSGKKAYTTVRSNPMQHIQHAGLEKAWDKIPRTIQDAILLVSRLGERYLWVDSLCFVQDSHSSWELNTKAMHLVLWKCSLYHMCSGRRFRNGFIVS